MIWNGWRMSKIVIADSSCLISLSKIGRLPILRQLFGTILIPPAVYHEVVVKGAGCAGAKDVEQADWIETRQINNPLAVNAFNLNLGAGESEAIALASECHADFVILDDWNARQTALGLSLPVVGTVALLKKATEKGFLEDCDAEIEKLRQAGFRYIFP